MANDLAECEYMEELVALADPPDEDERIVFPSISTSMTLSKAMELLTPFQFQMCKTRRQIIFLVDLSGSMASPADITMDAERSVLRNISTCLDIVVHFVEFVADGAK